MNHPIFLWGYMAAGKSRLGKRLAQKLSMDYIDLDRFIEDKVQMVIPEIFNQFGEAYFREVERDAVREFSSQKNIIVSCGGGAPCFYDNKSVMVQSGLVIYLYVEENELIRRLWRNRHERPLVAKMKDEVELRSFIQKHLAERMPYYSHAHLKYDNTNPKSRLDELVEFITKF